MGLWEKLARVFGNDGEESRAATERVLLEADLGPAVVEVLLERLQQAKSAERQSVLERTVAELLANPDAPAPAPPPPPPGAIARADQPPTVVLVFGVNGVGKTTTIAKLARRLQQESRSVLLGGADTFRAGAAEQLRIWADRLQAPFVGGVDGASADPAAVAFDAIEAGRARGSDTVIIDTAGRLHTEAQLLDELKKVVRVVGKRIPGAPHESLLVVDATVGQNAVSQAVAFAAAVPLTGLIVTKLDGTARGGAVVALRRAVRVPIRFLGTGERMEDLEVFDAERYARRLVSE